MKKTSAVVLILAAVLLCGCSEKNSGEKYVDIQEAEKQMQEGQLNIKSDEFTYDDKPYNIMRINQTIDDEFFYDFSYPNMKIDLNSGRVKYVCSIPGCAHTENSSGCVSYQDFISPVATAEGIYYVKDNNIMLYHDDTEKTVLTNTYYTDYEEEIYPDNKSVISAITISGDKLYAICPTYFFTYDLGSGEKSELLELSDSLCLAFAVGDNYVYHANQNMELFVYDTDIKTNKKLADKVGQVCCKNEKIYFIQYDDESPALYTADKDGKNIQRIIDDCYVNYCVTDSGIYYQSSSSKENVQRCDLDGKNVEKINFSDSLGVVPASYYNIISNSTIDHVFFVDNENDFIYAFKDGSVEFQTIQIEGE